MFSTNERLVQIKRMLRDRKRHFSVSHMIQDGGGDHAITSIRFYPDIDACFYMENQSKCGHGGNETLDQGAKRLLKLLRDNHSITIEEIVASDETNEENIRIQWPQSPDLEQLDAEGLLIFYGTLEETYDRHAKREAKRDPEKRQRIHDEINSDRIAYKKKRIENGTWDDSEELK